MFPAAYTNTSAELYISGKIATTGTVSIPGLGWSQAFTVIPGQLTTIVLPDAVFELNSDGTDTKGIHVVSNNSIAIDGFHDYVFESEGFLGLPTEVLGTDYLLLSYNSSYHDSEFGIVATADNTTVTIIPAQSSGIRTAGVPYTVSLNQGQTYQMQDLTSSADFTGTAVQSDKPIAVFTGSVCGNVPTSYSWCNYFLEEMIPTNLWGTTFGTVPLATRADGDKVRVLASQDGTSVLINGQQVATLDRAAFFETQLTTASYITASAPVEVMQYSDSATFDNDMDADPMMMLIPPFQHFAGDYVFATPVDPFPRSYPWVSHYMNVVLPSAAAGTLVLDGAKVDTSGFAGIPGSAFIGGQVQIYPGSHSVSSSLPFDVQLYGWALQDAYGYAGGRCFNAAQTALFVAASPRQSTLQIGNQQCINALVTDGNGVAVGGIGVQFASSGTNSGSGYAPTNSAGNAQYCYTGTSQDLIWFAYLRVLPQTLPQ